MSELATDYFRHQRKPLSVHIPHGSHRILDVGCGAGYFGAFLKQSGRAEKVYGIEIFKDAANQASKLLDGVVCADLDTLTSASLQNAWQDTEFDYIVFADVLEHLKSPWDTLTSLSRLLAPNGRVIVSLPNVRHWSVLLPLVINGRWDYQEAGIMDKTHLRFFTKKTGAELIKKAGFSIISIEPLMGGRSLALSKLSRHSLDEFIAGQWVFVAQS